MNEHYANWRMTTTVKGRSRQNPCEPYFRSLMKAVRTTLYESNLPLCFWSDAFDHVEEGEAILPGRSGPDTPYYRMTGKKPAGSHRRPFGCLCFPSVAERLPNHTLINKVRAQALPAIHVGYDGGETGSFEQFMRGGERCRPGYRCYIPEWGETVITDAVKFVPDCFPGLVHDSTGGFKINYNRIPF